MFEETQNKERIVTNIEEPQKNFEGKTEENKLQQSEILLAAQNSHNRSSEMVMRNPSIISTKQNSNKK